MSERGLKPLLQSFHIADWQADPFARGAYSYITPGGMNAPKKLSQPIQNMLFFAGEGASTQGLGGTVDAALATGRRAADQLLHSFHSTGLASPHKLSKS